jgi:ABC-type dipeptide/oligopeptide/nickel transport system permease component
MTTAESWLYLFFLIIVAPILVLICNVDWQKPIRLRHEKSGVVIVGYLGFSWMYLFFGGFVPIIRGELLLGLLHLILASLTFGIFQVITSFMYNRQHMLRQLTNGYVFYDEDQVVFYAREQLGMDLDLK